MERSHAKGRQAEIPTTRDDPVIGRFLSVDPHDTSYPELNPYHYVGNNPLRFIDPTGMDSVDTQNADVTDALKVAPIVIDWEAIGAFLLKGVRALSLVGVALLMTASECETCLNGEVNTDHRDIDNADNPTEFPEKVDDWNPPSGVNETTADEKTNGNNRQWKDENGKIVRRWDKKGRPNGKERGPHWHDSHGNKVKPGGGLIK